MAHRRESICVYVLGERCVIFPSGLLVRVLRKYVTSPVSAVVCRRHTIQVIFIYV